MYDKLCRYMYVLEEGDKTWEERSMWDTEPSLAHLNYIWSVASHPWCGTFDSACLQHRIFNVKCRSCNMNFASVIIATDHFNTHDAITMLGYQSVPVTGLTINPPTYIPTMVMINRSPPPSPAVLLHMISNHLAWLANEVANLPVPSYGTRRAVSTGRLTVSDLAFRRQLATCLNGFGIWIK